MSLIDRDAEQVGARLIAIEGIDGSGKGTQAERVTAHLDAAGLRTTQLSFPRYAHTEFGAAIGKFLDGQFGSLDEVHPQFAALLFAGDRFESRAHLMQLVETHDVVVLDRYVPSNIAHQASRLDGDERRDLIEFIEYLEYDLYGLPRPEAVVWLDVPVDVSQRLIQLKQKRVYTDRAADLQESDTAYLANVRSVYAELAQAQDNWRRIECCAGGEMLAQSAITEAIINAL